MTSWTDEDPSVPMTLTQTGSEVSGTYEYSDGRITGTVQGTTLTGIWTQDNGETKGPIVFVISSDGKTFSGWWGNDGDDITVIRKEVPTWIGKRV